MATQEFVFSPGQNMLVPAQPSPLNTSAPAGFGPSLTVKQGQAVGQKTSNGLMYPLNPVASDGTQLFKGFNQAALATDASSNVYLVFGGTAGSDNYYTPPSTTATIWTGGIFDPNDLLTAPSGVASVAEVDTFTPATVTTGDINSVYNAAGVGVEVTIGATQTAAAAVTLLTNAWNADPACTAIATASGTATFILTAVTKGVALGLTSTVVGTGTLTKVITTAAVSGTAAEVDTFTPGGTITVGDVYTLTITYPNAQTYAVSVTAGATPTATTVSGQLIAAWNADPYASQYAVATGTATVILTCAVVGSTMSVAGTVVGVGTISKSVTTPALGQSLAQILPGAPGARVLSSGYWEIP